MQRQPRPRVAAAADAHPAVRPRILLVDDEDLPRMVIARQLRQAGFHVIEARDGLEALARIPSAVPDLILTDLNMPRCDGEQLCAARRRHPAAASLPIVAMTGGSCDEARLRAAGFATVLYKPLSPTLPDILRGMLVASPVDAPAA